MLKIALATLLCAYSVYGYSRGAPACVDAPRHKVQPQSSRNPYAVSLVQEAGGDWRLTIGSQGGPSYKGLLLQANQSGNLRPANSAGRRNFKSLRRGCGGPAWTHSSRWSSSGGQVSEWLFTPAEGSTLQPSFTLSIVQKFSTFWSGIVVTP
eukprot:TRINITY_DN7898_c0_g1_i4.p1 TRINITY_DN7898_c0_g1~~TRINITY_DN7898_c0_g1_i4.p1  ORF type:complete len:152 (-),score=24.74 TRINITY_DN7898_c0_g1_i4:271-726(-)